MAQTTENRLHNIIEALGLHEDAHSIEILKELGTNSSDDEVRELTSRALIRKNTHDSLCAVILNKGKGINDLSSRVAMSAINDILELKDKLIKTELPVGTAKKSNVDIENYQATNYMS